MKNDQVYITYPLICTIAIVSVSWIKLLGGEGEITSKHIVAGIVLLLCIPLYWISIKAFVISTGVILILASVSIIALFPTITTTSYFLNIGKIEIVTPYLDWRALLLLLFYFICCGKELKKTISEKFKS